MATDNRKISVLDVKDDIQAANRAKAALADLGREVVAMSRDFERGDRSASELVEGQREIAEAVLLARNSYRAGAVDARNYREALDDASEARSRLNRVEREQPAASGSSVREGVDRFGTIGSQIFSGLGQSELANATGLLGDFAAGIGTLNPLLLVGTTAVGGLGLIIGKLKENVDLTVASVETEIERRIQLRNLIEEITSAELRREEDKLRRELNTVNEFQNQLDQIKRDRDALLSNANLTVAQDTAERQRLNEAFANLINQPGATVFGNALGMFDPLEAAISETSGRSEELISKLNDVAEAFASPEVAANDAVAAEEERTKALKDEIAATLQSTEELTRFRQQIESADQATAQRLLAAERDRREVIEDQITALGEIVDGDEEVTNKLGELNDELSDTDLRIGQLTQKLGSFIVPNIGQTIAGVVDGIKALGDTLADLRAKSAETLEKTIRPILDELDKVNIESVKQEMKFAESRAKIEADYIKDAVKSARDFVRQRARIERDAASSMLSAVARRDQIAFREAKIRREDELEDLKTEAEERATIREEERRERLDDLRREIQDFRQTNNQKRAELARQYAYEVQAEQARLTTQQSAAIARATIEQAGANTVLGIAQTFWQRMIAQAQAAANAQLAAAVGNTVPGIQSSDGIAAGIAAGLRRNAY